MKWVPVVALATLLGGCDMLFPEFAGNSPDASVSSDGGSGDDGGTMPAIAGVVCVLADVRDYRSCTTGVPSNLRVGVEETRQTTMADPTGHFTITLSSMLTTATLTVADPASNYLPTVVPVRLSNGIGANVALPIVSTQTMTNLELQNGLQDDPQAASFLGWAVDGSGTPVAGVSAGVTSALYDDAAPSSLSPGTATHQRGAIALLGVRGTTMLTLALTPPAPLQPDTFMLPLRAGALTMSTLVLLPKD